MAYRITGFAVTLQRVGETLNEVLAMTQEGEWDECCGLLTERIGEADPAVQAILIDPQYNRKYDARTLNKRKPRLGSCRVGAVISWTK